MWIICFRIPKSKDKAVEDTNRQVCFILAVPVVPKLVLPPVEFTHPEINESDVQSLQGLAAIDQIAEQLPDRVARGIRREVAAHMQSFEEKFGEGVKISRHAAEQCS